MEVTLLIALLLVPFIMPRDPGPGVFRNKTATRNLDCEWMTAEEGNRRFPGRIDAPRPRGDYIDRSVVHCQERLLAPGVRAERDDAILSALDDTAGELALSVASLWPELEGRTWLVEVHYPDAQVAAKVSFATKNALVAQGLAVSDRTPILAAGDVGVLTRLPPEEAYAAACQRYVDLGSVDEGSALLALVSRDPRETVLHAGVCDQGKWVWLK